MRFVPFIAFYSNSEVWEFRSGRVVRKTEFPGSVIQIDTAGMSPAEGLSTRLGEDASPYPATRSRSPPGRASA